MDPSLILRCLKGGLIVSCQALPEEPLYGAEHMAVMAKAAAQGGAVGIRANSPVDIAAIRNAIEMPIIGIYKMNLPGFDVYITPTLEHAKQVAKAGADIIALDATQRPHPDHLSLPERIRAVRQATGCLVMADISVLEEGLAAQEAGADLVGTTLSGYTAYSPVLAEPDFDLLRKLTLQLKVPVIAEGRIATPGQAVQALELGAFAVVVGSAITRPQWITTQFAERIKAYESEHRTTPPG